jgi:hypothetical protein
VILLDNGIAHPIVHYYLRQAHAKAPRFNSFGHRSDDLTYSDFSGITPPEEVARVARLRDRVWIFEWGGGNPLAPILEKHFRSHQTESFSHLKVTLYDGSLSLAR